MNNICKGKCPFGNGNCPNVKPYSDGEKRYFHTEVKCNVCGSKWFWGLSWDGDMDGRFTCDECFNKAFPKEEFSEEYINSQEYKEHVALK